MKKIFIFFAALFLPAAVSVISSCKHINQTPVVTLSEPADGENFNLPDTVHIGGEATDDNELHDFFLSVKNSSGITVLADTPYVHGSARYLFHYHFPPADSGEFQITATATDHELETATVTRTVHVH